MYFSIMNDQSPLLERARARIKKGRLSIPHRGRIRLFLLAGLLGIGLWIIANRTPAPPRPAQKASPAKKTGNPWFGAQTPPKKGRRSPGGRHISTLDLAQLLRQNPPRLTFGADTITDGGRRLVIHFSLDTSLQILAAKLFRQYHPKYGAIVAIDPVSGRVCALLSYTNPETASLGKDLYCRSIFPAASIFKTITAAAAIEKAGLTSASALRTSGRRHTLYKSQLAKDLGIGDQISLADAFAYSANPVFGRIGIHTLGAGGMREFVDRFGFNAPIPFELDNEAPATIVEDSAFALAELASGFNQKTLISPLFGALLASSATNHGIMPAPTLVDSVTDLNNGTVLYRAAPSRWRTPISARTAAELEKLMRSVVQYGTARKSFRNLKRSFQFTDVAYGGKTGSIDKDSTGRVDWFIGFARHFSDPTQHIAIAVVTVHGSNWTVHSSYVAAEIMRAKIRAMRMEHERMADQIAHSFDSTQITTDNDSVEE
jgi:peptidoglycan glycosyltransferase